MDRAFFYPEYAINAVLAPKEYFDYVQNEGKTLQGGLKVAIISIILYGGLNSLRSVASLTLNKYTVALSSSEITSSAASNFGSGVFSLSVSMVLTFLAVHLLIKLLGSGRWQESLKAITYASPAALLAGIVVVLYELFEAYVVGFPAVRFLSLGFTLFYGAYIQTRGIETLQNLPFKRALGIALMPALAKLALFAASAALVFLSFTSALA